MDTEQLGWGGLGFLMKKPQHTENLSVFMRSVSQRGVVIAYN